MSAVAKPKSNRLNFKYEIGYRAQGVTNTYQVYLGVCGWKIVVGTPTHWLNVEKAYRKPHHAMNVCRGIENNGGSLPLDMAVYVSKKVETEE